MLEALDFIDRKIADENITINRIINEQINDRDFMSKNILSHLRYLVEYCFFRIYITDSAKGYVAFNQESNTKARSYVKSRADLRELRALHGFLQVSTSHSLPNGDGSSRVLIKYLSYLVGLKNYMYEKYSIAILEEIYSYPLNIEKNMENYYRQILSNIEDVEFNNNKGVRIISYYVHKIKPIILDRKVFYEITLTDASDYINKFNRIVAYSKVKIPDTYSIKVSYVDKTIDLFGRSINIKIIDNYNIAIRPCELNNYGKIFGFRFKISSKYGEYDWLMRYLKKYQCNLLDLVELGNEKYSIFKSKMREANNTSYIIDILDSSRNVVLNNMPGTNILRYFLYSLNNAVIVSQLSSQFGQRNPKLSNLFLINGSIPFEEMPYASSLSNHNVDIGDLFECIDVDGREHELLSRNLQENADNLGNIYNKLVDVESDYNNLDELIIRFNSRLFLPYHEGRKIIKEDKFVYIKDYETKTISILQSLFKFSKENDPTYSDRFTSWILNNNYEFSDLKKYEICQNLFSTSRLALIYGSAGCGKTETIKIVSNIFANEKVTFLAKTNPAVENLKRRIGLNNPNFKIWTIDKYFKTFDDSYLLVIDECSTVDNFDMYKLLDGRRNFKLLLLVGDVYQIEPIKFGNWFKFSRELLPSKCINELSETFRTKSSVLLDLWSKVRSMEPDIIEYLANHDMSQDLNEKIFEQEDKDEIILCLNYDGPYGINNINKYLQADNENEPYDWGMNIYKVGDPILFNDLNVFYPALYNNLKGTITKIIKEEKRIIFQVRIEKFISDELAGQSNIKVISRDANSTIIEFGVNANDDDDKEDKKDCIIPFVIAYATSIHKSQGLEYNSVKIVLNDEIGDVITKNIFYTAITRTKEKLKIFWTPECMNKIVGNFSEKSNYDIEVIKRKIDKNI